MSLASIIKVVIDHIPSGLHYACGTGDVEAVALLLENGAEVDVVVCVRVLFWIMLCSSANRMMLAIARCILLQVIFMRKSLRH